MTSARDVILENVRRALGRDGAVPLPSTARVSPRAPGEVEGELTLLLAEIDKVGGMTRRLADRDELNVALAGLVALEGVRKATLWPTAELRELGVADALAALGVEIVPAHADQRRLAECDLGITGVDAALPETGTLLLRSSPEQPRLVSLLPRVHLAIFRPAALRADLQQALADVKGDGYCVFVTGPSRTADIELTLTIGVHGPKALHAWLLT